MNAATHLWHTQHTSRHPSANRCKRELARWQAFWKSFWASKSTIVHILVGPTGYIVPKIPHGRHQMLTINSRPQFHQHDAIEDRWNFNLCILTEGFGRNKDTISTENWLLDCKPRFQWCRKILKYWDWLEIHTTRFTHPSCASLELFTKAMKSENPDIQIPALDTSVWQHRVLTFSAGRA